MAMAKPIYPLPHLESVSDNYFGTLIPDKFRSLENTHSPTTRNWITGQQAFIADYLEKQTGKHYYISERLTELWHYLKVSVFSAEKTGYFSWELDNETSPPYPYPSEQHLEGVSHPPEVPGEIPLAVQVGPGSPPLPQNQAVMFRRENLEQPPVSVLDPNLLDPSGNSAVINQAFNPAATRVTYALVKDGSDWETVHIRDLVTGNDFPEVLTGCKAVNMAWGSDSAGEEGFFYNRFLQTSGSEGNAGPDPVGNDKKSPPDLTGAGSSTGSRIASGADLKPMVDAAGLAATPVSCIYWHQVDTLQSADKLIYAPTPTEAAQELNFYPKTSFDGRYLVLYVTHSTDPNNSIYYRRIGLGNASETGNAGSFQKLEIDLPGQFIFIGNKADTLYFQTTWKAPNGQIIAVDLAHPEPGSWQTIVGEQPDTLDFVTQAKDRFVTGYLQKACHHLKIYNLAGRFEREIPLPPFTTVSGITGRPDSPEIFVSLESFTSPACGYRYDLEKESLSLLGKPEVDFRPDDYETEQVFCRARDGARIPMFIIHKKGLVRNGANPTLLTGYGGFGLNEVPLFLISHAFWLEQGGTLAVANIRGGSEGGRAWYEQGRLANKQQSFDDFQTAARYLIRHRYTSPARLAAMGHSNGGLLTAVCAAQTPHLFKAIVCRAPLTDMLRYHRFGAGRNWLAEYGCAETSPEEFEILAAYSPLHNIRRKAYPAVLVTVSTGDERVHPMHAFKFVASLQANSTTANPILLRVEEGGGHGTGNSAPRTLAELSDIFAFLFKELGFD